MPRGTSIVTGASRGIGRAIATELSTTHEVIATYRGRRDAAESLRDTTGADIVACDISSAADREALIAHARGRFGRLDLLVNNAGIGQRERQDILEAGEESFDELIGVNLKGPHFPYAACRALDGRAGKRPHRVHHFDLVLRAFGQPGRVLHF